MFTGIVQEIGTLQRIEARTGAGAAEDRRIDVSFANIARDRLNLGDSICVDGVCLTVAALGASSFSADVSGETLRAGDSLGGHWVSGHVDGIAEVVATSNDARSLRVDFAAPKPLARYIARKGSVTLDGVSLTVNEVDGVNFAVNLIPHTLEVTTLGRLAAGTRVNLEIDLLARYVERLSENK